MWEAYRRTWIPTQSLILCIALLLMIYGKVMFVSVLVYIAVMELFAIFGAAWSVRLRGKFQRAQKKKEWTLR